MPRKKKNTHYKDEKYYQDLLQNSNIQAFLLTIRKGEGTLGSDGYYKHFNGGFINTLAVRPPHTMYTATHKKENGEEETIYSSAVGAYQFLNSEKKHYWDDRANRFGWTDILPTHQDIAALSQIDDKGAIQDILNGDIIRAINKTNGVWASLPGAKYNQPTQKLASALSFFKDQGGKLDQNSLQTLNEAPKVHFPKYKVASKRTPANMIPAGVADNKLVIKNTAHFSAYYTPLGAVSWGLKPALPMINGMDDSIISLFKGDKHENKRPANINHSGAAGHTEFKMEQMMYPSLSPEEIMNDILLNYPNLKNKWSKPVFGKNKRAYETGYFPKAGIEDPGWLPGIHYEPLKIPEAASVKYRYALSMATDSIIPTQMQMEKSGDASENKDVPTYFMNTGNEYGNAAGHQYSKTHRAMDRQLGKSVSIHLNAPMIGNFTVSTNDTANGFTDFKSQVEEVLLEILNNANVIH